MTIFAHFDGKARRHPLDDRQTGTVRFSCNATTKPGRHLLIFNGVGYGGRHEQAMTRSENSGKMTNNIGEREC